MENLTSGQESRAWLAFTEVNSCYDQLTVFLKKPLNNEFQETF